MSGMCRDNGRGSSKMENLLSIKRKKEDGGLKSKNKQSLGTSALQTLSVDLHLLPLTFWHGRLESIESYVQA